MLNKWDKCSLHTNSPHYSLFALITRAREHESCGCWSENRKKSRQFISFNKSYEVEHINYHLEMQLSTRFCAKILFWSAESASNAFLNCSTRLGQFFVVELYCWEKKICSIKISQVFSNCKSLYNSKTCRNFHLILKHLWDVSKQFHTAQFDIWLTEFSCQLSCIELKSLKI